MIKVLKLRNIRLREQRKLNENNLCLYTHITTYIKSANLTMYEKEEVLHQIMDMLLEAQANHRDKSFIVGEDYKKFCESIIDEYMVIKSKSYIALDYIQRYVLVVFIYLFIIAAYKYFSIGEFAITISNMSMGNILAVLLLFTSKAIAREAVNVPISNKSKINVNINWSSGNKAISWYLGVFIITLLIQFGANYIFHIDPYNYLILLNNTTAIMISILVIIFIIGVSVYKINYNRR